MELTNTFKQHPDLPVHQDFYVVQKAINGDSTAFATLFERFWSPLFHFISQRIPNSDDAQDLTMEAFSKAFLKLHSFVPDHAFSTWLFQIARNHCIDFNRKQKQARARHADFDTATLSNLPANLPNPEEGLVHQEYTARVFMLLQGLSPRYRRMIELRFYEELSYEEIALQLNLPIGTVKAQLYRAKELMRQMLGSPWALA